MSAPWPFEGLRRGAYQCIVCDPPWKFVTRSAKGLGKSPDRHYRTMTLREIRELPVRELADPAGCALYLWSTGPHVADALDTLRGWGFAYQTWGSWTKLSPQSPPLEAAGTKLQFAGGYVMRSACEPFFVGTIGRRPPKVLVRDVRNCIVAPVREHSRKPEELRISLERMYAGPFAELFARSTRPGWSSWGLEKDKFDHERYRPITAADAA